MEAVLIIHEYQAKKLLAPYSVRTPRGQVAENLDEAETIAAKLGSMPVVVKAQVHAGGRGKAGDVKIANTLQEVCEAAQSMLGKPLTTKQTGSTGKIVHRVLLEEGLSFQRELYASFLVDREKGRVVLMLCKEGGVEIEEVARTKPDSILVESINPVTGLMPHQIRRHAKQLDLSAKTASHAATLLIGAYRAFIELDASLIEFNPLVVLDNGEVAAIDAKMSFDDNGLFKHPEVLDLRDPEEEDPSEWEASQHGLSYIRLDGNIGCMVNGAGLAMATMDIIKLYGGEPANFLDVGGGTDAKRVANAFKIIVSDNNVKVVLVNIFGGIVRCDTIAEGILEAIQQVGIQVPLVVRLQGTKVERGRELLRQSGLNIISVETMQEAAQATIEVLRS